MGNIIIKKNNIDKSFSLLKIALLTDFSIEKIDKGFEIDGIVPCAVERYFLYNLGLTNMYKKINPTKKLTTYEEKEKSKTT